MSPHKRPLLQWLGLGADGRSALLERQALGLPDKPEPVPAAGIAAPQPLPSPAARLLQEQIASKLLHGWLQNRHQTLFPLALNLGNLPPPHRLLLAHWMGASAAMTDAPEPLAALQAIGGGPDEIEALRANPALPELMRALRAEALGAHAYGVALLAIREGPAGRAWLDYLAVALELPRDVTNGLQRRGRRLRPRLR